MDIQAVDAPSAYAPPQATRFRRRMSFVLALLLLVCILGGWLIFSGSSVPDKLATGQRPPALTVTATNPRRVIWPVTLTASGSIEPWQEASVGAQVGGYAIIELPVNVGDRVHRGQLLARLDPALLRAEGDQLLADNDQAQANRQRALDLQKDGAISDQEVLQAITAARVAAARLAANRLRLRYTAVVAPDNGTISSRTASLGAVTPAGQELFRLIRGNRLEWRGQMTAAQLAKIGRGQVVTLTLPDGSPAEARVREIAPGLDARSRLGIVYADVVQGSRARAGMYANGEVVLAEKTALVVPAESIVIRDGRSYVARLSNRSQPPVVALQAVVAGRRMGSEVEILSGLDEGASIVQAGAGFLSDGDAVRVAQPHKGAVPASISNGSTR